MKVLLGDQQTVLTQHDLASSAQNLARPLPPIQCRPLVVEVSSLEGLSSLALQGPLGCMPMV